MIVESRSCGSRAATRVRVVVPSRWHGFTGVVVSRVESTGTLFVRFGPNSRPLPFGEGEVTEVKS